MSIEPKRNCGYRKVGGLYLCGGGMSIDCHRLPMEVHACPVCSSGIKYSRGFMWLDAQKFFGKCENEAYGSGTCHKIACAVCFPPAGKHGLMWIGKKFYTPAEFTSEAIELGVSKRIAAIPRNFKLGETWIYLAHLEAGSRPYTEEEKAAAPMEVKLNELKRVPAVFYCFKPQRIEKIITESQSKNEIEMKRLELQGITPIIVPDGDKDHQGSVHDKK